MEMLLLGLGGQHAFEQGRARQDADIVFARLGENGLRFALIQYVVGDLDHVHRVCPNRRQGFFFSVNRNAIVADFAGLRRAGARDVRVSRDVLAMRYLIAAIFTL